MIDVEAVDVSINIDDFSWATLRYWLICPGVFEIGSANPSATMSWIHCSVSTPASLFRLASVTAPDLPLSGRTMSSPTPFTQQVKNHGSSFSAKGFSMPDAFSFSAALRTSANVCGGESTSRPASRKWLRL